MSRTPSVPGPEDAARGFLGAFVEHANMHDGCMASDGDEVELKNVTILNGRVLNAFVEAVPCDNVADQDDVLLRIRIRARVNESDSTSQRPIGHLLVVGVWATPEDVGEKPRTCLPVSAALESRRSRNEAVYVLYLYVTGGYADSYTKNASPDAVWIYGYESMSVKSSPGLSKLWDEFQSRTEEIEGVAYIDDGCNNNLRDELMRGVDRVIAVQQKPDYHPNTGTVVLDVVHPSLYPYLHGVSKVTGAEANLPRFCRGTQQHTHKKDFWERPYEDSKFQWLPSIFDVSEDGENVSISSYINNLDRQQYHDVYVGLERLFKLFLPLFEKVYSYVRAVKFHGFEEVDDFFDVERTYQPDDSAASLRGRELKVITKIVEYQLREGDEFDGVWHVEGMSHENIIATGLFILDREDDFGGGELLFKRAFLDFEAAYIFSSVPQCRHPITDAVVSDGLRPLGTLPTPKGRMIVFPNSHVHKLSKMFRDQDCAKELVRRRIIVFWLVNPECNDMVTTRGVLPQQWTVPREDALKYRLELMEERKRHKQDWNVREIELCEH